MNIYKLTLVAMFAALTAVGAFIKIPLPYIPITLQIFFVFLSGAVLGPRLGAMSQIIYIILGIIGLPIFAEGGGIGYVFHPTFGFLIGFVVVSYAVGFFLARDDKLTFIKTLAVGLLGIVILYVIAVPYFNVIFNKVLGIEMSMLTSIKTMLIFIPGDIIKVIGVALIAPRIKGVISYRI